MTVGTNFLVIKTLMEKALVKPLRPKMLALKWKPSQSNVVAHSLKSKEMVEHIREKGTA